MSRPEHIPARLILIVGSLTAFGPLCIDMYIPALPRIGVDLHSSASAVQFSLTATLIGLGLGQVAIGPLSDRFGRRRPLFLGLIAFVLASAACASAPDVVVLIALRFVQGLGGAAGLVISQAIVRDLYSGVAAARFYSALMLVTGLGPILAPQVGALLLHLGSWRLLFLALALAGTILLAVAYLRLPETLAPDDRSSGRFVDTVRTMRQLAGDRHFLVNAIAGCLGLGTIFAYVAGSSFVFENVYGLSPQLFSLLFAANGLGLVAGSQINARIVHRYGSAKLVTVGLLMLATASLALLVMTVAHVGGLAGVVGPMFVVMTSLGFVGPNSTALAMHPFPESAGSAAALLGLMRFSLGAAVAPLVGVAGSHAVLPLALVMAGCGTLSIGTQLLFRPRDEPRLDPSQEPPLLQAAESGVDLAV
ncbi:MAG: transporter [Pseudonocardiales bacterium]|nr:transporter [Pseudonocardiales bacterium]